MFQYPAHVRDEALNVDPIGEHPTHSAGEAALEPTVQQQDTAISLGELDGNVSSHVIVSWFFGDVGIEEVPHAGLAAHPFPIGVGHRRPDGILSLTCTQRHEACEAVRAGGLLNGVVGHRILPSLSDRTGGSRAVFGCFADQAQPRAVTRRADRSGGQQAGELFVERGVRLQRTGQHHRV